MKINKKIIFIILTIIAILAMTTTNVKALTREERELEEVWIDAYESANGMSKESLEEAIENLEYEISAKGHESYYDGSMEQKKDKEKLSAYRTAYSQKTGTSYGTPDTDPVTDPILNPGDYDPTDTTVQTHKLSQIGGIIVGIIRTVGSVVAVIALVLLGVKYMMGSVEDKAKYKESMIPYIVGMVMLLATVNILGMLYNMFFNIG